MKDKLVNIFLAEDDADDVNLALHGLRAENLANSIEVAREGEEALDFVFCRGNHNGCSIDRPPRLVLLDLKLPKVDGLEALRQMKSDPQSSMIPVVIMTSSRHEADVAEGYKLGVNSSVQKPMDFKTTPQDGQGNRALLAGGEITSSGESSCL